MWAVVEIGKKQYLVEEGVALYVERIKEKEGEIFLDKVLLFADKDRVEIGQPYLSGFKVKAEIKGEEKGPKVVTYKYRRRKKSRRKRGHRQIYTYLTISKILPA